MPEVCVGAGEGEGLILPQGDNLDCEKWGWGEVGSHQGQQPLSLSHPCSPARLSAPPYLSHPCSPASPPPPPSLSHPCSQMQPSPPARQHPLGFVLCSFQGRPLWSQLAVVQVG